MGVLNVIIYIIQLLTWLCAGFLYTAVAFLCCRFAFLDFLSVKEFL